MTKNRQFIPAFVLTGHTVAAFAFATVVAQHLRSKQKWQQKADIEGSEDGVGNVLAADVTMP